ncbi:hypothetical protein Fmac_007145 [Flemingia macrophylla]|uniref:Protein kinase domain-containing protein n=1 Tax=Flemingia macrophylla TaxID=520843 RepID=A0ABD1NFC9_9FABA
MNCFPCFRKGKRSNSKREPQGPPPQQNVVTTKTPQDVKKPKPEETNQVDIATIQAQNFTFRELAIATKNFRQECLMGEGGFGRVYRGTIPATGQVVAVKQLDRNGVQGSKEFLAEVLSLSLMSHENLVKLTGYCADGDQRLLVYEFMPGGSLEGLLLERKADEPPLDWYSRMKIASHAAKGLWYLHDKASPSVIYRDLKSSNILLDNDHNAKLSDYGLVKLSGKDKMNIVPTRVMGTYGYSAPEYVRTGSLTLKSDVYSFGVVLLELITGRRVIDTTRPHDEQNLVSWAQPIFRDPKRYPDMADPNLNKIFPEKDLNQVVAIAAMCLQEEAAARPLMSDVVTALSFLSTTPPDEKSSHNQVSAKSQQSEEASECEYDYDENENEHSYSPQDTKETTEFYFKSISKSRSSSSSDSENGSTRKTTKKSSLSQKSSKKSSASLKSSKRSSVRVLSHKRSDSSSHSSGEEDYGGDLFDCSGSRPSEGNVSIGLISSESAPSDNDSSIRSGERSSMHLDHSITRGSEEGSVRSQ